MNYRHIYHAGNFADVVKHIILVTLLQALQQKDKGFCYLDTHAGVGRYDLIGIEAQKTGEFNSGIARLYAQQLLNPPAAVQAYLNAISVLNPNNASTDTLQIRPTLPRFYPGSPQIALPFLRPQDRMILSELHPQDAQQLKQEFVANTQVAVHQQDGYLALKAFLPPNERRGLVLIDPPYEQGDESVRIIAALQAALKRWETGIYAVWYPLKEKRFEQNFRQQLKSLNAKALLFAELSIYPEDSPLGLNGSGMAILNPPWQLDTQLNLLLPWLWQVLSPEKMGGYRLENAV